MSDHPSETGAHPSASYIPQPENPIFTPTTPRHRRNPSHPSDERIGGTKPSSSSAAAAALSSSSSSRRPGTRKDATFASTNLSSRGENPTMQRSTSPQMSPDSVHYTRTGRISKAKKGLKVHHCGCGRSYTRAEHLRRHQKNHATDSSLQCDYPGCGKPFFRLDLLQRHQDRHNETDKDPQITSPASTAEPEPQVPVSATLPPPIVTTLPQQTYYQQPVSPIPEAAADASSYKRQNPPGHNPAAVPVPVDGLQNGIPWNDHDPFNNSPDHYSSSGEYPSPGGYPNMFATTPYGTNSNRTRNSSNASFIEPWVYPSRSPTSATSYSPATSMAYMTTYPMPSMPMAAGVDPMSFGFGPKTMLQRDEEEAALLFVEQPYGMGQLAHTYPSEHYLNNYWRFFHPSFPIVHRTSFESLGQPPMLHAAMIAIGGQYSNDASVKRKSRILHDRCVKLLERREREVMTESERVCDWQSIFLVEVLSQYRARRAAKTLSPRFETLYHRLHGNFHEVTTNIAKIVTSILRPDNATVETWMQWLELSTQQRLLLCCYILECQQATLLARVPQRSAIPTVGFDLPLPSHAESWEATTAHDWAVAIQQHAHTPTFVYEVPSSMAMQVYDTFQSSLLIATHYNYFSNPAPYLSPAPFPAIDHLFDGSPITRHHLLTAKLLQLIPVRALLAVSGESWILSEKVPSAQAFAGHRSTVRNWVSALWTSAPDHSSNTIKEALKLAIEIAQHAMTVPTCALRLEIGADMGLYFAALTIWAATVAANSRLAAPQQPAGTSSQSHRYQTHSPLPTTRTSFPSTPTHFSTTTPSASPTPGSLSIHAPPHYGSASPAPPASPSPSHAATAHAQGMQYSEMAMLAVSFLSNALCELELLGVVQPWPRDGAAWQQGCGALMRWVKMRLRNGVGAEGRDSVVSGTGLSMTSGGPTSAGCGVDGFGELLDGVLGVLEKMGGKGWEGWGFC